MANRRMFSLSIVDTDTFLDMPVSARCLYYDLSMRADDDGFVNPKKVIRVTNASDDDLKILIAKQFVIPFQSGVIVIKDWKIHNYIRRDTYTETIYKKEKSCLSEDDNKAYILSTTSDQTTRIQSVDEPSTQVRIGKDRIGKREKKEIPPELYTSKEFYTEIMANDPFTNYDISYKDFQSYYPKIKDYESSKGKKYKDY